MSPSPWGVPPPPVGTESAIFNAARPTAFLLVEGRADQRFWQLHTDSHSCQVREHGGREPALAELRSAGETGKRGVVACLDADFDRLDGTLANEAHVVWTDLHDLELVLIHSPALERLLIELGSTEKRADFERERGAVRDALLAHGVKLGRLRWLSKRQQLGLVFRKDKSGELTYLPYQDFCDLRQFTVDDQELVQMVLNFSNRHDLKANDLLVQMNALPEVDAGQLCVGHDLLGLLEIGLRKKLGSKNHSREEIERALRLAFHRDALERTEMFAQLTAWEAANAPFRLFAPRKAH